MRINKFLAKSGVCSRRGADELIRSGAVTVNGRTAQIGEEISDDMVVCVHGREIRPNEDTVVIAYYKPVGVTCTEKDDHAERIVTDEIKCDRRVTYAGRLDKDSEGLLIMTDDGDLIEAMMRGSNYHEKEYEVWTDKPVEDHMIEKFMSGIYLDALDTVTRPCKVTRTGGNSFNIILTQGLNRQIRRMCEVYGLKIVRLKRTRVMNITLQNLQVGASRELTPEEKKELYLECGLHI